MIKTRIVGEKSNLLSHHEISCKYGEKNHQTKHRFADQKVVHQQSQATLPLIALEFNCLFCF